MAVSAEPADPLPAGEFASWLAQLERALRGEADSDVPCGTCTACCTSSQFVQVAPDETETLARIPGALRFPAPGLPAGHVVMGYDENGHCPMFADGACSIYEHRPRTCRTYDCRIFAATGVEPDHQPLIDRQAGRWRFTVGSEEAATTHEAVATTASYLRDHREQLGPEVVPVNPTALAVLAVEIHRCFLRVDDTTGRHQVVAPSVKAVREAIRRRPERRPSAGA